VPAKQPALNERERGAVRRLVAEVIVEEDQAEAERAARERTEAAEAERRVEQQREAREAADDWVGACAVIVEGLDLLCSGLKRQDEAGARLLQAQIGATVVVGRPAALRRFGNFAGRRLFDVCRSNRVGRIVLNAGGCAVAGDFVAAEAAVLARLLDPPEQEDAEYTNGGIKDD
jgi:hypothetical protein